MSERQRTNHQGVSTPNRARIVVIGGGIVGTSVAYHLT